ncbi:MAG: aminotransferase class I/II-fold pyridoxal phosphate-dependent enzyme, partial [Lachnospiraceae bacterium]|nr:aminotransferase class I/II-fold pyridoxal phosphate-dependent enzyme [Lachnospiraceae bacterium]
MAMIHGGDIYRNYVKSDFSVNINPLGIPEAVKEAICNAVAMCGRYPDPEAEALRRAVVAMLAVPEEYLLFGNGASELFMAIVHAIKPKKTVIPVPSFYGYEYAAGAVGGEIIYYEMRREDAFGLTQDFYSVLSKDVELTFLANPNNPTGKLMSKEAVVKILEYCKDRGIYVVLDECFIEFCGRKTSMISESARFDNLILVRAFTKIFSIPGVRLGYLVC